MPDRLRNIEVRSDEVQEIISSIPKWIIRWGITLVFAIIVLLLAVSWFVKYPDVITGSASLTTTSPPIKLINKNSGEIESIFFEENDEVKKGDVILSMNNLLSKEGKEELSIVLNEIELSIENDNLSNFAPLQSSRDFGSISENYARVTGDILSYKQLVNENKITFDIANLRKQISNHSALRVVTKKQLQMAQRSLENATAKFQSEKELYENGVISKTDYYNEEKQLISAKNEVENLNKMLIQNDITITNLEKDLNDLEFDFIKKKESLIHKIKTEVALMKSSINEWELNYQISAPIDGMLTYLGQFTENQYIEQGKELFAIVPDNQEYVSILKVPLQGYGKISKGQEVRLKFDNYPFQEFGRLKGRVDEIAVMSNEEFYEIKVVLTNGLITTYNREIKFSPEMSGSGEIVTRDLRLLERIFNRFTSMFDE